LLKRRAHLVAIGFAGMLGLIAGTGHPFPAWAQHQSSTEEGRDAPAARSGETDPSRVEPQSDAESKDGTPRREPRFLPPLLRPKVLTPEELEEAERLKKLAARFGTDPTAIVGRVQLSSEYAELPQGAKYVSTVVRVDLPFRGNWLLRLDFPFERWSDPNRSGATSERGMSDLSVTAGWRAYNTPEYAFFLGAVSTFPTAAENTLGSGKYTAGPLIATARFLPRWESFLFGIFQHQISVGGDPARRDVQFTRGILRINTIWAEQWWTDLHGIWQVDWERNSTTSMTLEFEGGRNLVDRWGIFLRPGVGVWGRDVPGAYEWNIEIGIRRIFGSL